MKGANAPHKNEGMQDKLTHDCLNHPTDVDAK